MSTHVRRWCRCGATWEAWSTPASVAVSITDSFAAMHDGEGCEITADPAIGRRWRAVARRRDLRVVEA